MLDRGGWWSAAVLVDCLIATLLLFLPSLLMVAFGVQSMTPGLLAGSSFVLLFGIIRSLINSFSISRKLCCFILAMPFGLLFLAFHYAAAEFFSGQGNLDRFILSLLALFLVIVSAFIVSCYFEKLNINNFRRIFVFVSFCLVLNGIATAAGFDFSWHYSGKPTFFFYEPSHFALLCAPFLFTYWVIAGISRYVVIVFALGWGLYVQSLLMIVVVIAPLFLTVRVRRKHLVGLMVLPIGFIFLESEYYIERLTLSSDSANLSVLVFLQGWENAVIAFKESLGFGVGFQQFGIVGSAGGISTEISRLAGFEMNLLDGGTTASKIVGEFGVIGLVILLLFLLLLTSAIRVYRLYGVPKSDLRMIFYSSCVISYGFELFLRGVGYFSPGAFLFLMAVPAFLSRLSSIGATCYSVDQSTHS